MDARRRRFILVNALLLAFLVVMRILAARTPAPDRSRRPPSSPSHYLSVSTSVERDDAGSGRVTPPDLSIIAWDGRTGGLRGGSQGETLPRTTYELVGSRPMLDVEDAAEGTYGVEVIGTAAARYDLHVDAGSLSGAELRTTTGETLRDVPIVAGAVHRYDVAFALADEEAPIVRIAARNAPVPGRSSDASFEEVRPARLDLDVGRGCESGPFPFVRLVVPGGHAKGDPSGEAAGTPPSDGRLSRGFVFWEPVDGEYVVEISAAAASTSYSFHASFHASEASHALQPSSPNCTGTTVFRGELHRWVVRLQQEDEVPLRLLARPDTCAPADGARGGDRP